MTWLTHLLMFVGLWHLQMLAPVPTNVHVDPIMCAQALDLENLVDVYLVCAYRPLLAIEEFKHIYTPRGPTEQQDGRSR